MIESLIGAMIGLGLGVGSPVMIGVQKVSDRVLFAVASTLIFAAIGWMLALVPDSPRCEAPAVSVSTPNIKGCMQPHDLKNLDPEVLKA